MSTYRFRIYLIDSEVYANNRTFDVSINADTVSQGQAILEAQYSGARVTWLG